MYWSVAPKPGNRTTLLLNIITEGGRGEGGGEVLLNADWLKQGAIYFLNHEGTFGNQKGMITWLSVFAVCGNDLLIAI